MAERRSSSDLALAALGHAVAARPFATASRGLNWTAEGARRLASAARIALGRRAEKPVPADLSADPAERWEEMRRMNGLSEADVEERRRAARANFIAYLAGTMAMVLWAVLAPLLGAAPHVTAVLPWLVALVLALKTLRWSHVTTTSAPAA